MQSTLRLFKSGEGDVVQPHCEMPTKNQEPQTGDGGDPNFQQMPRSVVFLSLGTHRVLDCVGDAVRSFRLILLKIR